MSQPARLSRRDLLRRVGEAEGLHLAHGAHQGREVAHEQREQQDLDVRAIDIGVGMKSCTWRGRIPFSLR